MADEKKMSGVSDMISRADAEAMVAAATQNAVAAFTALLAQSRAPAESGDIQTVIDKMAMAIGGLTAQSSGRKYIAPELLEKREQSRLRMEALLARNREQGIVPKWKLVDTIVFDDTVVLPVYIDRITHGQKSTEILWPEAPNKALRPVDDAALEVFDAFIASIQENPVETAAPKRMSRGGLVVTTEDVQSKEPNAPARRPSGMVVMGGKPTLEEIAVLGSKAPMATRQVA